MGKLYFIMIMVVGGYFYSHPEKFDELRGEAGAKVVQTVNQVQEQASEGLIGVVQNTGDGTNE